MRRRPSLRLHRLTAAAVLSLALASGLSACGGDDADSDDSTSEPSETAADTETEPVDEEPVEEDPAGDFVVEANAVCEAIYPAINAVGVTLDPADPSTVTTDFLPLVQELQDELVAVTAPDDLADAYAAVLDAQQVNLDAITADPAALFEIDPGSINADFDALGLTSCGSGSSAF